MKQGQPKASATRTKHGQPEAGATVTSNVTLLASVLHSWKSYTAKEANRILGRSGEFWQREYYDYLVRDEEDFYRYLEYTLQNPVKAGLCERWEDWPWNGLAEVDAGKNANTGE
jgi:putative DNA methylase